MQNAPDSHVEPTSPPLLLGASSTTIGVEVQDQKKQQRALDLRSTSPAPTLNYARSSYAEKPILHHEGYDAHGRNSTVPYFSSNGTSKKASRPYHYLRHENERHQQETANLTKESEDMRGLWQAALDRDAAMRERANTLADEVIRLRNKLRDAEPEMEQA